MENKKKSNVQDLHPSKKNTSDQIEESTDYKTLSVQEIKDLCPSEFEHHQQTVWLEIASIVNEAGRLLKKNVLPIKQVVPMICIFRDALEQVGLEGLTWETGTKGRNGNQKKPHALLPTITAYNKEISAFCTRFGLDPASEARLKDPRQGELDFEGWK